MADANGEGIRPLRMSNKRIIAEAESLFRSFVEVVGFDIAALGINFNLIYDEVIYPKYEILLVEDEDLGHSDDGEKILGRFDPESNTVFIDANLDARDPRRAFTCWHEMGGHAILQGDWLRSELKRLGRSRGIITTESMLSPDVESRLERQANLFASHAAAPSFFLDAAIRCAFQLRNPYRYVGPRCYTFSLKSGTKTRLVESFPDLCMQIANFIKRRFGGLSSEALSYRVAESPWVIDLTAKDPPSIPFSLYRKGNLSKPSPQPLSIGRH